MDFHEFSTTVFKISGVLILIFGIFCLIEPTRNFMIGQWQDLLLRGFVAVICTMLGVYIAFYLDYKYNETKELELFSRELQSVQKETEQNQAELSNLQILYAQFKNNDIFITTDQSKAFALSPRLYRFGGRALSGALRSYQLSIEVVRSMQIRIDAMFKNNPNGDPVMIMAHRDFLNQAIQRSILLQEVIEYYQKQKGFNPHRNKEPIYDKVFDQIESSERLLEAFKVKDQNGKIINLEVRIKWKKNGKLDIFIYEMPVSLQPLVPPSHVLFDSPDVSTARNQVKELLLKLKYTIEHYMRNENI